MQLSKKLNKFTLVGWISRGVLLVCNIYNAKLILNLSGENSLAIYSILFSLSAWISLLNLGLPITALNKISSLKNDDKRKKKSTSNIYGTIVFTFFLTLPLIIPISFIVKKFLFIQYQNVSLFLVLICLLIFFISAHSQVLIQLMYANQKPWWPNAYPAISALSTAIILTFLNLFNISNLNAVIISSFLPSLIVFIHCFLYSNFFKAINFNLKLSLSYIKFSYNNLIFSFLSALTLSIDYIMMSFTLSSSDIVIYNLTNRIFAITLVLHTVILSNSWSKMSHLQQSLQMNAARNFLHSLLKKGILLAFLLNSIIFISINKFISFISNKDILTVPYSVIALLSFYSLVRVVTDTYSMALLSNGKAAELNKLVFIQAILSLTAQWILGTTFGLSGFILGIVISFLLTNTWFLPLRFYDYTRST